ncbi:hypothetical protein CY34DRAFT_457494 [Suillus luteus UH-Slu-Lm8-n1]|uniref:Uncharacterized protein n=1 Tax=Suillus luteus UH-Slu-Lm8-n1 TaxID=930992 RepID=A0A0D0B8H4_9AGAM|nr:hypothetical protein CY34DRAFT_457494 [Suillus luteus UH-Slu-Lm8-n1]
MSSPSSLSLERFRLDGMMIACIAYGIYFLLTVQAWMALMQLPRRQHGGKNTEHRLALLFYVFITFVLGSISTALNIKYTQMIWIDDRDAPGGPVVLIKNYMSLRMNFIALAS